MSTGKMIAVTGRLSLGFGEQLLNGIKPERFARLPEGKVGLIPTNHPAWVFGHLGLYGSRVCGLLGDEEQAQEIAAPEGWDKLFGFGTACQDDPDGSVYPEMGAVVDQYRQSAEAMITSLEAAGDAVFEKTNPIETMRDRFPTIGVAAAFMSGGHAMMHLGQVSAWRRIEGLGPAMKL